MKKVNRQMSLPQDVINYFRIIEPKTNVSKLCGDYLELYIEIQKNENNEEEKELKEQLQKQNEKLDSITKKRNILFIKLQHIQRKAAEEAKQKAQDEKEYMEQFEAMARSNDVLGENRRRFD